MTGKRIMQQMVALRSGICSSMDAWDGEPEGSRSLCIYSRQLHQFAEKAGFFGQLLKYAHCGVAYLF